MLRTVDNPKYKVGQVWTYRTRPYEAGSVLTIVKTEVDDKLGSIIHIHLQGLRIKNPQAELGFTSFATHLPCSEEAIDQSVTELRQASGLFPGYEEGHQEWRKAFDAGNAGIWSIPVAEMVAAMETVLNQPQTASE